MEYHIWVAYKQACELGLHDILEQVYAQGLDGKEEQACELELGGRVEHGELEQVHGSEHGRRSQQPKWKQER